MIKRTILPKIKVFTGTMFSGKSTALMNELERYKLAGFNTLLVKPLLDDRYSDKEVVNHNGIKMEAHSIDSKGDLSDLTDLVIKEIEENDIKVLGIDEVQFFSDNIVLFVEHVVNQLNISVVVAGLDMDYLGRPFGSVPNLMAIADEVKKFKAVCKECGRDAIFEYRISNDNDTLVVLGSSDKYIPLCRRCYNNKFNKEQDK